MVYEDLKTVTHTLTMALLEAGPEMEIYSLQIVSMAATPHLHETPISWNYKYAIQHRLNGCAVPQYSMVEKYFRV